MKIKRTRAFIEIIEAMNNGNEKKANAMVRIVSKSIAKTRREKGTSSEIALTRREKVYFD